MRRQLGCLLLMLAGSGCLVPSRANHACHQQEAEIREVVARKLISQYDSLPPQVDDPIGRNYCLGFDFSLERQGRAAPLSFVGHFADNPRVHPLSWCQENDGRLVSVGPVQCKGRSKAHVRSFSWVRQRPGGGDCTHLVLRADNEWIVGPGCLDGLVYN